MVPATVVTDELPPWGLRATVLSARASPSASASTTVTVDGVDPSAGTWVGAATTAESAMTGSTGGGVPKVTVTACPASTSPSVVSVAVYMTVSFFVSVTPKVAWPAVLVVGEMAVITELPPAAASEIVLAGTGLLL